MPVDLVVKELVQFFLDVSVKGLNSLASGLKGLAYSLAHRPFLVHDSIIFYCTLSIIGH